MQEVKDVDAAEELYLSSSRAAVLADAEALLTCYGVGEESGAELLHAVVELCFTSSVRFLQPGLLLKVLHQPPCMLSLFCLGVCLSTASTSCRAMHINLLTLSSTALHACMCLVFTVEPSTKKLLCW